MCVKVMGLSSFNQALVVSSTSMHSSQRRVPMCLGWEEIGEGSGDSKLQEVQQVQWERTHNQS